MRTGAGNRLLLAVDGGGTHCRARLADFTGKVLGEAVTGPANIRLGLEEGLSAVVGASRLCLEQAGLNGQEDRIIACLALAGACDPSTLYRAQASPLPFHRVTFTSDARAACIGAHAGADGGIVIVGTGSVGWGIAGGREFRVGGWGFPLSDEGSGAWLGYEVLRQVLRAHDGLWPWTDLLRSVSEQFESNPFAIVRWMRGAGPRDYAGLAPLIVSHAERGDAAARDTLGAAAAHIEVIAARLLELGAPRLSLMGGLGDKIEPYLSEGMRANWYLPWAMLSAVPWRLRGWRPSASAPTRPQPMSNRRSWMAREIEAAPEIIAQQAAGLARALGSLVLRLRGQPPHVVVTCARGSSAHAATFAKHLIERLLGLPVAEAAPSIASLYQRRLHLRGQLVLAISQSGNSDDLVVFASQARGAGALTVAVTNDAGSPLAATCEYVLPIGAGPERSVAATKTFLATAAVLLRLVGAWTEDAALLKAASQLPDRLAHASRLDWSKGAEALSKATHLAVIGRGPTLAIAREAALKLKETCNLHTEAFSGAEFLHGPIALVRPNYPVLVFAPVAGDGAPTVPSGSTRHETDAPTSSQLGRSNETRSTTTPIPSFRVSMLGGLQFRLEGGKYFGLHSRGQRWLR